MGLSRADLHIHTTRSDGTASPEQVARALADSDLAVAAVTDHDAVEGAMRSARRWPAGDRRSSSAPR
jgi:predicted metal-dependent phosphoesterase TrpH